MTTDSWDQGPGLTSGLHDQIEIAARLKECCFSCVPALVVLPDQGAVLQARFADGTNDALTVDLFSEARKIQSGSVCCVSFLDRGRSCVFVTEVLKLKSAPPPHAPGLVLRLPQILAWTEARQAFRVPVVSGSGFEVQVDLKGGKSLAADPLDLSFTGVALEFASGDDPNLSVGAPCAITMNLRGERLQLDALVERRYERVYGLSFPTTCQGGAIRPPGTLRSIIRVLERRWIDEMKPRQSG